MYYLHMSKGDIEETDVRELEWFHSRLVKQKVDERTEPDDTGSKR